MEKELKPITKQELIEIFRSQKFKESVGKSALITYKKGLESGFLIVRNAKDKAHFSKVVTGRKDSCPELADIKIGKFGDIWTSEYTSEGIYPLFDLHFHPIGNYACPSGPRDYGDDGLDLKLFTDLKKREKFYCRPICAIGIVDKKTGEMLLLQEQTKKPLSDANIFSAYSQIIGMIKEKRNFLTTQDIANEFSRTGLYSATSLEFKLNGREAIISDEELEKLVIFAYTPCLIKN